ncbi:MAG TPA: isochorismatase family cysteine hydrolase [Nitrososphaeraceae archaeon]|nr:isochorismatase family cysteine hydrolase [Nitrososphaeraceae archaeon]
MKNHNNVSNKFQSQGQNWRRPAILVIDMQNDFVKGKLKCERVTRIVPSVKQLLENARKKHIPIFYCIDEHLPIDRYEMKLWGPHAMKGTEGARIIDELKPREERTSKGKTKPTSIKIRTEEYVIPKRTYSAFDGTGLDKALRGIYDGKGADTLIVTGLHTNICDRHTCYDAFVRGFNIIVPEDGVEAFTEEEHKSGLQYMENIYGAKISKVKDIIHSFPSST